jgi:hypothetical protein
VPQYARELSDAVLAGTKTLNEAYDEAQKRKEALESDEEKLATLRCIAAKRGNGKT